MKKSCAIQIDLMSPFRKERETIGTVAIVEKQSI